MFNTSLQVTIQSLENTDAPLVLTELKERGGEIERSAETLVAHWRDSVLSLQPSLLKDWPIAAALKVRREEREKIRREEREKIWSEKKEEKGETQKKSKVKGYGVKKGSRHTSKRERAKPKNPTKKILERIRVENYLKKLGEPFDDMNIEEKKKFGLSFYFKHLLVRILLAQTTVMFFTELYFQG